MKTVLISLFLARFAAAYLLRYLNLRHLKRHGTTVPVGFAGAIDQEALSKSARYTLEQHRVGLAESVYDSALLLAFLFTPLLQRGSARPRLGLGQALLRQPFQPPSSPALCRVLLQSSSRCGAGSRPAGHGATH